MKPISWYYKESGQGHIEKLLRRTSPSFPISQDFWHLINRERETIEGSEMALQSTYGIWETYSDLAPKIANAGFRLLQWSKLVPPPPSLGQRDAGCLSTSLARLFTGQVAEGLVMEWDLVPLPGRGALGCLLGVWTGSRWGPSSTIISANVPVMCSSPAGPQAGWHGAQVQPDLLKVKLRSYLF